MYQLTPIDLSLNITHMVSVHYFEYSKDFDFSGEAHEFWEFLYVDKGEVGVSADHLHHTLQQGQMIFHKPGEWHTVKANGLIAPNLVVVSFCSDGEALALLENKIITIDNSVKHALGNLLTEAKSAYTSDLSDPSLKALAKNKNAPIGSQQLLKNYLESMLIHLIRKTATPAIIAEQSALSTIQETTKDEQYRRVMDYLTTHLQETITLGALSKHTLLSISSLERLIHQRHQCGVIAYVEQLRIDLAKQRIREGHHNFSELSAQVGYHSIHYFSRVFKKRMGMTLSEYAKTV